MQAVDDTLLPRPPRGGTPGRRLIPRDTLTHRVIHAWFNMSKSTRRLLTERPSESRLLLLLMMSNLAFFFSWTLKAVVVPHAAGVALISTEVGALFLLAVVGRTAAMYLFAMTLGAFCRVIGGRGSWRNTRAAVFWGAFVAAPFGVVAAVVSVLFTNLEVYYPIFGAPWIALPPYWMGLLPFVWYISVAVARAQGFRKVAPVFLGMSVVSLVGLIAAMYFYARGLI